jgi:hypothetical protein
MRLWQRPRRFASLVKERSRAWSSALLVATLTLGLASFGAITPPTPAQANNGACPANTTFITYTYSAPNCTATISFSGAMQTFTVPSGVTEIFFNVTAAEGGQGFFNTTPAALGGTGGTVSGRLATTGGTVLNLFVGGKGGTSSSTPGAGGFNGGGVSGVYTSCGPLNSGGGGGASDIRIGGSALANRVVVAGGGGGGASYTCSGVTDLGGNGGSLAN